MDVGDWLRSLGLERYEAAFRENEIDETVLLRLTAEDLKELGVGALGHRRKLLDAITALRTDVDVKVSTPPDELATTEGSPKDTAERRQVTVMFSDLVGSTTLSARMDPEDLREVISAYQKCVAEIVRRSGGFVAKYMGDGVLVYFGYPQAHEDDAERAVRAGLELIGAVSALKPNAPLQTRVGIATGLVVVGDLIGSGEAQERGIVGETPNLAARLQGLAEPNMVVVAEGTRKLLGNLFELEDLGAKDLKGIAGPVRAWAALRASSAEGRFEALHATGLTALVGREEELELLLRRWSKAKTGEGQVVLLSGEAGIGKSRLTAALLERLASEPHTRLRYFCSPQHTDSAFYPIIGQIERAAGLAHEDTLQARLDKLDAMLVQTSTSKQDAALFAELLSLPNDGRFPALDLAPEQRRQKTLEALTSQLTELARRQPVLMIFEDAHWTDPTSLEAFGRTVDRIKALPALLIVTFRPDFNAPWAGQSHVTSLALNRLGEREAAAIIAQLVGNKELPADVSAEIVERTDGIPLFVEEMTKAVLEAESEGEARRTAATVPSAALAVPASLHASLMARLDRLGPAKEVVQIGSAIGREFSHALLAVVARQPEAELGSALDRLIAAGLLFRQGVPPHASYLFKHALVQDAAYGTLLRKPRRALHARIAETLESQFAEIAETQPELLAHHCAEAGLNEKAVGYLLKAGQQAYVRSAMTEAVAQFQKGLDLLPSLPDNRGRQQQEIDLQIGLGHALQASKGFAAPTAEAYGRARELVEQLDARDYLASLLHGLWTLHYVRGELKVALALAEELENFGKAHHNLSALLVGKETRGLTSFQLGELTTARALFEQCDAFDEALRAGAAAANVLVLRDPCLAVTLGAQGYIEQGRTRLNAALTEARGLQHAYTSANVFQWASIFELVISSPHEALRYALEETSLSNEHGFPMGVAWGNFLQGFSLTALGRPEEGLDLMTKGLSSLRAMSAVVGTPWILTALAAAYGALGRPVEGLDCLGEAAKIIEKNGEWVFELPLVRGDLLLATGDRIMAEESYRRALAIATQQGAKTAELRGATVLARLWRDAGKRTEARNLLAPVYNWFTEGFDTPVLMEAKALLDQLHA
jgi:class 3 adenylate cyclase/tetratricopeptide (TPR) repeat protein